MKNQSNNKENSNRSPLMLIVLGCLAFALLQSQRPTSAPQPAAAFSSTATAIAPVQAPVAAPPPAETPAGAPVEKFGWQPNPAAAQKFLRSLKKPTLRQAGPTLFEGARDRQAVLLYRALLEIEPDWKVGTQKIGDCVSWGWAHGCDMLRAVEIKLGANGPFEHAATEGLYGGSRVEARGVEHNPGGDGSYGAAAAKFCTDWGVPYRRAYPDLGYDLTQYSGQRASDWGEWGCGGRGDAGRLDTIVRAHPLRAVALVQTFDEAAPAISSGYPVPVCSNVGFTKQRDKDGFAKKSGQWSHCMCFIGVRYDRPGLLCLNSWGTDWISGPRWPEDQPEGSFWVDAATCTEMLSAADSYAISATGGFPRRILKHNEGW